MCRPGPEAAALGAPGRSSRESRRPVHSPARSRSALGIWHLPWAPAGSWLPAWTVTRTNRRQAGQPARQVCAIVRSPARQRGARYAIPPAGGASMAAGAEALLDNPRFLVLAPPPPTFHAGSGQDLDFRSELQIGHKVASNPEGTETSGGPSRSLTPDRAATLTMPDRCDGRRRITLGADKADDIEAFVADPGARRVTPISPSAARSPGPANRAEPPSMTGPPPPRPGDQPTSPPADRRRLRLDQGPGRAGQGQGPVTTQGRGGLLPHRRLQCRA